LIWLATFANDLGATTVFLYGFREREYIMDLLEMAIGARITLTGFRIGGVARDIPDGWVEKCREFLRFMPARLEENDRLLTGNRIFRARCQGVGILPLEVAINYGVSGPTLRGSGLAFDIRKYEPYEVYDRMDFVVPTADSCDVYGRYLVRIEEMRQSLRIIAQALAQLPDGPVAVRVPRILRPPASAEAYGRVEAPRGDYGVYLVSDGSNTPARLRIRAPSFPNVAALPVMLKGAKVADVVAVLGSLDIVLGEIDR